MEVDKTNQVEKELVRKVVEFKIAYDRAYQDCIGHLVANGYTKQYAGAYLEGRVCWDYLVAISS